jgi:hypothetical protein
MAGLHLHLIRQEGTHDEDKSIASCGGLVARGC